MTHGASIQTGAPANPDRGLLYWFDVLLVAGTLSAIFLHKSNVYYIVAAAAVLPLVFSTIPRSLTRLDVVTFGLYLAGFLVFALSVAFHKQPDVPGVGGGVASAGFWIDRGLMGTVLFARLLLMQRVFDVLRLVFPIMLALTFVGLTIDKFSAVAGTSCRISGFAELPFTPAILFGSFALFYFALWQRLTGRERILAILFVFCSVVVALGYTLARGAFLGVLTGWLLIGASMLWFRPAQWRLGAGGIVAAIIAAGMVAAVIDTQQGCSGVTRMANMAAAVVGDAPETATAINLRLQYWGMGWEAFTNSPILGSGPGYEKYIMLGTGHDHVHQQYLSWAIWFGIPGLLAGLAFLFFPLPAVFLRSGGFERSALAFALASCLPISLLVDSLMRITAYIFFHALFGGFVFAYLRDTYRPQPVANASNDGFNVAFDTAPEVENLKGI